MPVLGVRNPGTARARWPGVELVGLDYVDPPPAARLRDALAGVDVVVNAVGIFREHGSQRFDALHVNGPAALFAAAAAVGARVVQVSALGAHPGAPTAYLRSKGEADAALLALPVRACVVQPSLVFAPQGASTRWFALLAALPVAPLPAGGVDRVQPLHLDDLCAALLRLVESETPPPRLQAVGPRALPLREYLSLLGRQFGLRPRFVAVPRALARAGAALMATLPGSLADPDALRMLEAGSTGNPSGIAALLGRAPRDPAEFVAAQDRAPLRTRAQLGWLLPLLRWSLAAMWIATAVVSAFVFPLERSLELLARAGLHGTPALVALYGAAALDALLGVGMLALRRRRWLYRAQLLLVAGYTAIITLCLPEFWSHPYGPVLKNLPLLAAIALLHALDHGDGPDHA